MAALTFWPTLATTEGRVVDTEWEDFFERNDAAGRLPFKGDMSHPGWSAVRVDPPIRADENVVALSALVLDYDGGHTLDDAREMWGLFYGYVHTTRKHEPGSPRYRVILPLSREVTPDEYALLWRFVVQTSEHHVDPKTRNPSRFWFLPGGRYFESFRLTGHPLDPDALLAEARELEREPPVATRIHPGAETRADRYALGALERACGKVELAPKGSRNNTLFVAASTAGNFIAAGCLNEGYAVEQLEKSALAVGLPRFEARRTIRSGIARGKRSPRQVPEAEAARQRASTPPPEDKATEAEPSTQPPQPHRLEALWKTVGELGFLDTEPPPEQWILKRPDTETNEMGSPIGLLPRSEVGMLLAAGGTGKSFALMQLALSVATGRKWLDYFLVDSPGRVLLVLGEEKNKTAHRRLRNLSQMMRLTDRQALDAKRNIVLMTLSGVIAPLVAQEGSTTVETDVMPFLRSKLSRDEWTLILIDPLSRFAGADTEKDNAQATTFVQVAETLCEVPGNPTVLFAHHTNKTSRTDGAAKPSAADSRGSSAVTDGGRWCANLMREVNRSGVSLTFTKNNYAPDYLETIHLERALGGYLRVQTETERQRHEHERDVSARQKVIEALTREPGLSKNALRSRVQMKSATLRVLIDEMERDGDIYQKPRWCYQARSCE